MSRTEKTSGPERPIFGLRGAGTPLVRDNKKMPEQKEEAHGALLVAGPIDAGPLDQLPPGSVVRVNHGVHDIALINTGNGLFAVTDLCLRCSHALSKARMSGSVLCCAQCGWQYDVARGSVVGLPLLRVETHDVSIEGGRIFIEARVGASLEQFS